MKYLLICFSILCSGISIAQNGKSGPLPTKQQLAWHENEFYLFMHFGPNTFTDKEWGEGNESEAVFNPTQLDCKQWCAAAKAAGAKGIIITAKHHDGFCLWPSKFSKHTVRESSWKDGKGDVLKELSTACRESGLRFGVYVSPWDRNHPDYGTDKYNDDFAGMLREVLLNYGPVWELWWDGANGEGPNGKQQVYDWKRYEALVRKISPQTVIFSDIGPDIRWTGNENGIAGDPNWNFLDTAGFKRGLGAPHTDTLAHGNVAGKLWIPAECDVSIRPGWFWHAGEDAKVKTAEELFQLYLKSVGRGANLLLNVPPDNRGLITDADIASLTGFKQLRDESFGTNLLKDASIYYQFSQQELSGNNIQVRGNDQAGKSYSINLQNFNVQLQQPTKMNCIILREAITMGQTIRKFRIILYKGNRSVAEIQGNTIGHKRIVTFPQETVTSFRVILEDARGIDNVSGVTAYLINEKLVKR